MKRKPNVYSVENMNEKMLDSRIPSKDTKKAIQKWQD